MNAASNSLLPGWRRRIGLISPTVLEVISRDFYGLAPDGVDLVGVTCMMEGWSADQYTLTLERMGQAAGYLGKRGVDFIIHVGTPLVVSQSTSFGAKLIDSISAHGSAPASTTIESALAAFEAMGLSSVALVSPFTNELNGQLAAYIQKRGFSVPSITVVETPSFEGLNDIRPEAIYRAVHEAARSAPMAEGFFLPCGQMRSLQIAPILEAELGLPVLTQNAVDFWRAFEHLRITDVQPGKGMLFDRLQIRSPRE